jgi:hypothetical protein
MVLSGTEQLKLLLGFKVCASLESTLEVPTSADAGGLLLKEPGEEW